MKKAITVVTDYLFPKSDFITGVGSVFNIPGNFYEFNSSKSGKEADIKALNNDWSMVGNDLYSAKEEFDKENNLKEAIVCEENC